MNLQLLSGLGTTPRWEVIPGGDGFLTGYFPWQLSAEDIRPPARSSVTAIQRKFVSLGRRCLTESLASGRKGLLRGEGVEVIVAEVIKEGLKRPVGRGHSQTTKRGLVCFLRAGVTVTVTLSIAVATEKFVEGFI